MAGQESQKKYKINYSSVHEEFDIVENYFHPGKEAFGEARKCKACKAVFAGKNSTNIKNHLQAKHKDVYQRVQSRVLMHSFI